MSVFQVGVGFVFFVFFFVFVVVEKVGFVFSYRNLKDGIGFRCLQLFSYNIYQLSSVQPACTHSHHLFIYPEIDRSSRSSFRSMASEIESS